MKTSKFHSCPACGKKFNNLKSSQSPLIQTIYQKGYTGNNSPLLPPVEGWEFKCRRCDYRWAEMKESMSIRD